MSYFIRFPEDVKIFLGEARQSTEDIMSDPIDYWDIETFEDYLTALHGIEEYDEPGNEIVYAVHKRKKDIPFRRISLEEDLSYEDEYSNIILEYFKDYSYEEYESLEEVVNSAWHYFGRC